MRAVFYVAMMIIHSVPGFLSLFPSRDHISCLVAVATKIKSTNQGCFKTDDSTSPLLTRHMTVLSSHNNSYPGYVITKKVPGNVAPLSTTLAHHRSNIG